LKKLAKVSFTFIFIKILRFVILKTVQSQDQTEKEIEIGQNNTSTKAMSQDQRIIHFSRVSNKPVDLVVEVLIVTDPSVYEVHKRFCKTNDKSKIFQHMRIYYSHIINGVNHRFLNSLKNDTEMSITLKLTNFLFLTVSYKTHQKLKINP